MGIIDAVPIGDHSGLMANSTTHDRFSVAIFGETVECKSLEDAVDVKAANDILSRDDPTPYTPKEICRLTAVLTRYGLLEAAKTLNVAADRSRRVDE